MKFQFENIGFLLGLIAVPLLILLFWQVLRWKKRAQKRIGDERLVVQLIRNFSPRAFLLKFILAITALVLIIAGGGNLQKPGEMEEVERKGVDVIIALDVSRSMLAQDIQPNRLERAKQFIHRLINKLPDDRIGLILFAGRAYMQMPLTVDHASAAMYVQNASPLSVPTQGTVISEALRMSDAAFQRRERKFKSLVLITDGEDHDPESVKLAEQLASNGIMINTIGIGSPEGSIIPDEATEGAKKDENGNTIVSKLNEEELKQLATLTKGIYLRLQDPAEAVTQITNQLATIEETALEDNEFKKYKSFFQWFLAIALLLLVVEFFLPEKKWRSS